jgi:hypothetical protein
MVENSSFSGAHLLVKPEAAVPELAVLSASALESFFAVSLISAPLRLGSSYPRGSQARGRVK